MRRIVSGCRPGTACVAMLAWFSIAMAAPGAVHAQTDGWLAAGAGIVQRVSTTGDAGSSVAPVLIVRLGRGGDGWGVRYGLNWYTTDVDRALDGRARPFGRLRVRPILLGYGYGWRRGRTRASLNMKAGYAFSSFQLQPAFAQAYGAALNSPQVRADAGNTFVLKPEAVAWIDLGRTIGLNISAGYMLARPSVNLLGTASSERSRLRADMFMVQVGAVYSVF